MRGSVNGVNFRVSALTYKHLGGICCASLGISLNFSASNSMLILVLGGISAALGNSVSVSASARTSGLIFVLGYSLNISACIYSLIFVFGGICATRGTSLNVSGTRTSRVILIVGVICTALGTNLFSSKVSRFVRSIAVLISSKHNISPCRSLNSFMLIIIGGEHNSSCTTSLI